MSDTIKIIYSCDHALDERKTKEEIRIVTATTNEYDVIDTSIFVVEINDVVDDFENLYKKSDYKLYTQNKIKWVGRDRPQEGSSYKVYTEEAISLNTQYAEQDCPRCEGNGWYVSILDPSLGKINKNNGFSKLVQDTIKMILTKSNGSNVGTDITNLIGSSLSEGDLMAEVVKGIHDAENKLKKAQVNIVSSGGEILDEEMLQNIEVTNIELMENTLDIFVEIKIMSKKNNQATIGLEI